MASTGKLHVTLMAGKDIKSSQLLGRMDVFAVLAVGPSKQESTVDVKCGRFPMFHGQQFAFHLEGHEPSLEVVLLSKTRKGSTEVGVVSIAMAAIMSGQFKTENWIDLQCPKSKKAHGKLRFCAHFEGAGGGGAPRFVASAPPAGTLDMGTSGEGVEGQPRFVIPVASPVEESAQPGLPHLGSAPAGLNAEVFVSPKAAELPSMPSGGVFAEGRDNTVFTPPKADPRTTAFIRPASLEQNLIRASTAYGRLRGDTHKFADTPSFLQRVLFYTDQKHLFGLQTFGWEGEQGDRHMRGTHEFPYAVLELAAGEYITEVTGAEDESGIAFLELKTTEGRKKHFGGRVGASGSPFSMYIPSGHVVVGWHGGFGVKLHCVGVLTAPGII